MELENDLVKICLVRKACVREGGELEHKLVGIGSAVRSCSKKRLEKKTLVKMLKFSDCNNIQQIQPSFRKIKMFQQRVASLVNVICKIRDTK